MANTTNILKALSTYTGEADSLNDFVQVVQTELGDDWTDKITQVLPNLPQSLQQKLDHAMQYYGATSAWNELQSYLIQETALDIDMVSERIPTLAYWLDFFEEEGRQAVQALQERLNQQKEHPELFLPPVSAQETDQTLPQNDAQVSEPAQEESQPDLSATDDENNMDESLAEIKEDADQSETSFDDEALPVIDDEPHETAFLEEPVNQETPFESQTASPDETGAFESDYSQEAYQDQGYQQDAYQDETYPQQDYQDESYQDGGYLQEPYQQDYPQQDYQQDAYQDEAYPQDYQQEAYPQEENLPAETYQNENDAFVEESLDSTPIVYEEPAVETNETFMAKKVFREIDFLNQVRSWINARCIALGKIEIYSYKHYGFLIDIMEETKKDVQEILANPIYYPAIEQVNHDGLTQVKNMLVSLEEDLKIAYDNLPSEATPLIDEDFDGNALKSSLGRLDTSNQKEYLGPAPDGFEMVDDPYEEKKPIKSTLLKRPPLRAQGTSSQAENQNNTSQTAQSGVQRKMSFSFNKKNPT